MAIGLVIVIINEKVRQKVEPFFKRCVKKWSTFPKSVSKSDAPFKVGKTVFKKGVSKSGVLFQKLRQKVTHLYKYQGF